MFRDLKQRCRHALAASLILAATSGAIAQTTYTSTDGPVTITDNAAASVYPTSITVAGETLPAGKVTVRFNGLSHTNPDDIDLLLVSPQGVKLLIMSDCGGTTDLSNFTITLDDAAASQLPDNTAIADNTTWRPRNVSTGDSFPAPAPAGPYVTSLSNVRGMDANGTWSLYIVDDTASNSGSLTSWSITVTPAVCVTNVGDSGAGSLRQAITDANAAAGRDYICFNIPGAGPHTIALASELPNITGETVIDGFTQPGSSCAVWPPIIKIVLDGQNTAEDGLMFSSSADGSAVRGLNIQRFTDNGIEINGADDMYIQCNFIGTDVSGSAAAPNGGDGIRLNENSDRNLIGGVILENLADNESNVSQIVPVGRNVISGNGSDGIMLKDADDNRVMANYIGVNAAGNSPIPNASDGIDVDGNSAGNRIGTDTNGEFDSEEGNVISGNTENGVYLHSSSRRTVVVGNRIGLSADGNSDIGNGHEGVYIHGVTLNRVGVADSSLYYAERNYISGNGRDGVKLDDGATLNIVAGNFIGMFANCGAAGNDEDGVELAPDASFNLIGSNNDGTIDDQEGNSIAFNTGRGISAWAHPTDAGLPIADGNTFSRNSIFSNGNIGIDLGADGVTANDTDDPDHGPNEFQNFPVIVSVSPSGDVVGSLNSVPSRRFRIEFFASATADPTTYGEGEVYLGSVEVSTDAGGDAPIAFSFTPIPGKPIITATATDLGRADGGNDDGDNLSDDDSGISRGTSEFSQVVTLQGGGQNPEPGSQTVTTCEDTCKVITLTANNADGLDYVITALPTNGTLYQYNNGQGDQITSVPTTVTDSQHRVVFCPDADENGSPYAIIEFKISNNLALFGPGTVTINVTPVNDRPSFGIMANDQNPITFMQDGGRQCKDGFIINFNPGPNEAGQTVAGYVITEYSDNGILCEQPYISLAGKLCVKPKPGECGVITFRLAIRDNGGTATCSDSDPSVVGIDTSYSIPVTITITCVNTPPTASCKNASVYLDGQCTLFSQADLIALINNGSSDPEDGTNVTLQVLFEDETPVPDGYEFPLGSTTLKLKVCDHGMPLQDRGDDGGDPAPDTTLCSTCTAKVDVYGEDCNNNGFADTCDIIKGRSNDCNHNWVPDECDCFWDNGLPVTKRDDYAAIILNQGQLSHLGGGAPLGAKVADDFELAPCQIHHLCSFQGLMLTNTTPFLRKAKLEFYEDCNGSPSGEPIARFLNGQIVDTVWNAADGFDLVTWYFDLSEAHLWLDGGKTYWVSLMGISDNVTPDLSFWVTTSNPYDPMLQAGGRPAPATEHIIANTPRKAFGLSAPTPTSYNFGPWSGLEDCCIGCVNMAFKLVGSSCPRFWDNGQPDLSPLTAGGSPSGANGPGTARTADNFVSPICEDVCVCVIEAWVWTDCHPPTAFIEIYRDAPCVMNYDFDPPHTQRIGPETETYARIVRNDPWSVQKTTKTIVLNGTTYTLYHLIFGDLKLCLEAGHNYWLSAGVNGDGAFTQHAFFAYNDPLCPYPGCDIKISPGQSRTLTPPPATPWSPTTRDYAFRLYAEPKSMDTVIDPQIPDGSPAPATACIADTDGNGVVDSDDLFSFLDAWFAGCP